MKRVAKMLAFGRNQLVPLPWCLIEERRILRRINSAENSKLDSSDQVYLSLNLEQLKESHHAALGLREQLQRRAQGYLMAVTVATSFTLGAVALLAKRMHVQGVALHWSSFAVSFMLFVILISFGMSAWSALRVLGPSKLYDLWLRSRLPNQIDQEKVNLIRFTKLNEAYAMAYEVQLRGSYVAMRNGVLFVFAMLALAIWQTAF